MATIDVAAEATIGFWPALGAAAAGVALSVLVPWLRGIVLKDFPANRDAWSPASVWESLRPYVVLAFFSVMVAVVVVAAASFANWQLAFLAGYAFDKTLQSLTSKPPTLSR